AAGSGDRGWCRPGPRRWRRAGRVRPAGHDRDHRLPALRRGRGRAGIGRGAPLGRRDAGRLGGPGRSRAVPGPVDLLRPLPQRGGAARHVVGDGGRGHGGHPRLGLVEPQPWGQRGPPVQDPGGAPV
ncbi:MAG: hypothetical protein AVDCRST_MAG76-2450, partial [uncultured Acidimicrobiales bacterium]